MIDVQEIEKAQHELDKASKDELKKAKILHKAEAVYKDAVADKDKVERKHLVRSLTAQRTDRYVNIVSGKEPGRRPRKTRYPGTVQAVG